MAGDTRIADPAQLGVRVAHFGPEGEGWDGTVVSIRFNQPMRDTQMPRFTFEPELSGRTQWTDAFHLTFTPQVGTVRTAHRYAVSVDGVVESVGGERESIDLDWTVATQRPAVKITPRERYYYRDDDNPEPPRHWKASFTVGVTHKVSKADLQDAIRVFATPADNPDGPRRRLPFRLERDGNGASWRHDSAWIVSPRSRWPLGSRIVAQVDDSLVGVRGPLPVAEAAEASFVTADGVHATLACEDAFEGGCGPSQLELKFDRPVLKRELRKVTVTPRPADLDIDSWWDNDGEFTDAHVSGKFEVGQHYTVRIAPSLRDSKGQPLAGQRSFEIDIVPPSPSLELSSEEGILPAAQPAHVGIESRFLRNVEVAVASLGDRDLAALAGQKAAERALPEKITPTVTDLALKPGGLYKWSSNVVDLAAELGGPRGAAFVRVSPGRLVAAASSKRAPKPVQALFQVTDLGALVGLSPAMSFVRVSALSTGKPVEGAHVTVYAVKGATARKTKRYGPSDAQGIVRLPPQAKLPKQAVAVVHTDDDRFAVRMANAEPVRYSWREPEDVGKEFVVSTIVTDRPLYKPGESVRVMGWAAQSTPHTASGLRAVGRPMVDLELVDPRGRVVAQRRVRIKRYGKFWGRLELPSTVGLGRLQARAKFGEREFTSSFKVRDFRTPAFDIRAAVAQGDIQHGGTAKISANATYLHGMATPINSGSQHAHCRARSFVPSTHSEWAAAGPAFDASSWTLTDTALVLDEGAKQGHIELTQQTASLPAGGAYGCNVAISVQDAAHEQMGADASFNVHPSRYLLMGPLPWSIDAGNPITINVEAADFSGQRVTGGKVVLNLKRQWWDDGRSHREPAGTCRASVAATGSAQCTFKPKKPGRYDVVLVGKVDKAKVTASRSFRVWRASNIPARPKSAVPTRFELSINSEEIDVGGDAVLTMANPEKTASGVVAMMHGGLRGFTPFTVRDHRASVTMKVRDAWIPSMEFAAFLTSGGTARDLPKIHARGHSLRVPYESRRLDVGVAAPETAAPGDTVSIAVDVRDSEGLPAAAHVTVWAVDEAILALEDFHFPDFVKAFAVDRGAESRFAHDFELLRRPYVRRDDPWETGIGLGGIGTGGGGGGSAGGMGSGRLKTPSVRRKFEATPIFVADVFTGDDGRATVEGTMPENLTTFRILAIASAARTGGKALARFGRSETRTRVTTDLAVRPMLPRVMRPGDVAEIAAIVDNLAGAQGKVVVDVELRDNDGVAVLHGKKKKRATAASQTRVPFEIEALRPGTVKVLVTAALAPKGGGAKLRDAMEVELPIKLERTLIRKAAHHGSVADKNAVAVAVQPPTDAAAGSRTVSVSLHTSLLGGYKDNVDELVQYPYGCVEQTSTRLVPLLALADLQGDYPLGISDAKRFAEEAVARIEGMQTSSGGFGYWPGAHAPHFYATAYASWVLSQAQRSGISVPKPMMQRARRYLSEGIEGWASKPHPTAHENVRVAMGVQAIAALGGKPDAAITRLLERQDKLPTFAKAVLLMAMHDVDPNDERSDALLEALLAKVEVRDAIARTVAPASLFTQYFDSPIRTDAMVLLALTTTAPQHPLIEKLARGLTHARDAGQLRNTQENAYALLAMAAYARLQEAETPDLFARAWLGAAMMGEASFSGRTFDVQDASAAVSAAAASKVTLAKQGAGRLYFRVGMQWAPAKPPSKPRAQGLVVQRTLSASTITAGEAASLEIAVTADTQRDYVVVEVPLPAGLEAVDTTIGKGGRARSRGGKVEQPWVNHRELRADRVVLFVDHLGPGRHVLTIPLRATTPGRYQLPPARAESMYYPEIFGHTAASSVVVRNP